MNFEDIKSEFYEYARLGLITEVNSYYGKSYNAAGTIYNFTDTGFGTTGLFYDDESELYKVNESFNDVTCAIDNIIKYTPVDPWAY